MAELLIHSNLISQTAFPVFALWSASVSGCPGPCPMLPSFQVSSVAPAPHWQLPPLPQESSSKSKGIPYYFSPWWWHSCCHCTSQCKYSVLSDLGAMVLHQHAGPESSHSTWPGECSLHPHMYDSEQEGINHLTTLGGDYFIVFCRVQYFSSDLVVFYCGSSWSDC